MIGPYVGLAFVLLVIILSLTMGEIIRRKDQAK